ncbi:MAG: aminodeoxychorismate synthase component I [Azospira sp.]|jgi:para-aminobenzoate synthetase/4-amino-4-deoxychorismate lyase|nr:aminodeoxychorismate synthase component I [Azospira sp.]
MTEAFALLDAPGGGALLFSALRRTLPVDATNLAAACAEVEQATAGGLHVVAALDYELGYCLEPAAGSAPAGTLGHFWLFAARRALDADELAAWLAAHAGDPPRPACIADFRPRCDAAAHARALARIRDWIAAGDCYQVNFTFPFEGRLIGDPLALYARLRAAQPVAHGGLVMTPEARILSFSPELFVERHGQTIRSQPMKGTAARSGDAAADAAAAATLAASAKERAENVMIVDLIRNDLGRIARPGSVRVESLCAVESYPSVHQMSSSVVADCDAGLAETLAALFPCGSITGAPKVRAMQIVRELESAPRGLYTGALGWVGPGGDFHFNVAIRTLLLDVDGGLRYGVGSGIVWDSGAAAEYAECLLKAGFVTRADPGFRLIETLRLEDGDYPLLALHLVRLHASAAALSFACDRKRVTGALRELAATHAQGVFRVRLTLGRDGDIELTAASLPATPGERLAVLSPQRLDSRSPWLRHKTTVRDLYERELARLAADPAVFDAIFLNERGEVCEGARSSVFVRRTAGGPLLTPPLASGLLPGVLRRQLLESGEAVEAVLYEEDLRSAAGLWLGNALRGLLRVRLTS